MRRLLFLIVLSAALCCGQAMDDFAWWDSPIAQNLNLTPEQHKQIQAAVREFRDRLIEQRAAVQKSEANLMDLMNEDQVNEARTREMIDKVVSSRGELMRTLSLMSLRLRMVLTPQQWQELRARRGRQLAQRQPGGPGLGPGLGAAGRQAIRPRLQQPLPPARRQLLQQRLRQLDRRLQQGGPLNPEERQEILDRLHELQQLVAGEGEPAPAAPARRGPSGPPPPGQMF